MERRTVKILVAIIVLLIILGSITGLVLGLKSKNDVQLEVWPRSEDDQSLIQFRAKDPRTWYPLVQSIDGLLQEYRNKGGDATGAENRVACSSISSDLGETQVCDVPVDDFHPCISVNRYNYEEAEPCIFLKLNKILDWKPELFNSSMDLPPNMPEDLKQHIRAVADNEANTVWVSCEGENPADVEFIGAVQYLPRRGFPAYYYPFTNKEGYLSPLVAVLFQRLKKGVLINIECKAWAKNIRGSVHFELMVDDS